MDITKAGYAAKGLVSLGRIISTLPDSRAFAPNAHARVCRQVLYFRFVYLNIP
jgi:hypothetical protein